MARTVLNGRSADLQLLPSPFLVVVNHMKCLLAENLVLLFFFIKFAGTLTLKDFNVAVHLLSFKCLT